MGFAKSSTHPAKLNEVTGVKPANNNNFEE